MTYFILTDDALEKLTCNMCYKYLSVTPVTVFFDGLTLCGRCLQIGEGGTLSLFKILADKILFKCVNRWDGCKELLHSSQVEQHELSCKAETYECPYCPLVKVPTFLLIKHFEILHPKQILQSTQFKVEVAKDEFRNTYLYRLNDYAFFVEVKYVKKCFYFSINQLSKPKKSSSLKQNFMITSLESVFYGVRDIDVGFVNRTTSSFYIMRDHIGTSTVFDVVFSLIFQCGELIKMPRSFNQSTNTALEIERNESLIRFFSPSPTYRKGSTNWPRMINILKPSPTKPRDISLSWNSTAFICNRTGTGRFEVFPYCVNCSEINEHFYVVRDSHAEGRYLRNKNRFNVVCYFCYQYYKQICDNKFIPADVLFSGVFRLKCTWKCDFSAVRLLQHELKCTDQPKRRCPFRRCSFEGSLQDISIHFHEHKEAYFSYESVMIISFMKIQPEMKIYFWLAPYFAILKLEMKSRNKFVITVSMCNENAHLPIVPQMLLFASDRIITMRGSAGISVDKLIFVGGILGENNRMHVEMTFPFILLKCFLKYSNEG